MITLSATDLSWAEAVLSLRRPLTLRERIGGWFMALATKIIGYDSEAAFERVRQATLRSEQDVGTNRVPRESSPRMMPLNFYIGKTSGSIAKGSGSGTVTIWDSTSDAAALAASSQTLTNVYNPFASIGATKWVLVIQMPWAYLVCAAEC